LTSANLDFCGVIDKLFGEFAIIIVKNAENIRKIPPADLLSKSFSMLGGL